MRMLLAMKDGDDDGGDDDDDDDDDDLFPVFQSIALLTPTARSLAIWIRTASVCDLTTTMATPPPPPPPNLVTLTVIYGP